MTLIPRDATALAGILLVVALVLGTGAFSTVTADRTATISVAGDDSALLAIAPIASEAFLDTGELQFEVTATTTTTIDPLFSITNQGSQPVGVWIIDIDNSGTSGSGDADIIGLDADNTGNVTFFNTTYGGGSGSLGNCENGVPSIEGEVNAVELEAGETLIVGVQANSSDVDPDEADLLDEMVIHADASVPGVSTAQNHDC